MGEGRSSALGERRDAVVRSRFDASEQNGAARRIDAADVVEAEEADTPPASPEADREEQARGVVLSQHDRFHLTDEAGGRIDAIAEPARVHDASLFCARGRTIRAATELPAAFPHASPCSVRCVASLRRPPRATRFPYTTLDG